MNDTAADQNHNCFSRIRLLLLDVDGVLTDGRIYLDPEGRETIAFSIQDGVALKLWQRTGRCVGLLSGRDQPAVRVRAAQLRIDLTVLGRNDKIDAYEHLLAENNLTDEQVAYMGDDLLDLPVMGRCGYVIAPANAVDPVKAVAKYVTLRQGGHGAAAEAVQHLLTGAGQWEACLDSYRRGQAGRR
jgi:3-deoxy-D-manno-octulosonate 8-phosphate phosphatase (KDO 8-P phosphatase)